MTHDQPENPDLAHLVAEAEQHERDLVLTRFTHDDAWRLGCLLVELAAERTLPITIDVRRGPQQVFHAATEGTTPDNDSWVQRKVRVVERFGASSYLMGLRAKARGRRSRRSTSCRSRSTRPTAGRSRCGSRGRGDRRRDRVRPGPARRPPARGRGAGDVPADRGLTGSGSADR
ncbi:heme-binding protein [Oerskovia sp. M15]